MKPIHTLQLFALLSASSRGMILNTTITPPGCRKLNTDIGWPSRDVWENSLPGIIPTPGSDAYGPLPDYRLQVKTVSDVQNAVRFATRHNIRLTVLTTGHDQLARSDAGSGLIIDLSLFNGVQVSESFTPTGEGLPFIEPGTEVNIITPKDGVQAAVTFGPARAGLQLNYAVGKSGLFSVSGAAATVALGGGWGQNGGYGPLTAQYGLGVDQWLEAQIVTPDGELSIANKVVNPDLFWAIRGGGGGTFGVIVQATWKVYPTVPMTGFNWYMNSTLETADLEPGHLLTTKAMEYLLGQLPDLKEKGITLYVYAYPTVLRGYAIHPAANAGVDKANAVWGPILEKMQSFPGMTPFQTRPFDFANYREFFDTTYGPLEAQSTTPQDRRNRGVVPYDSRLLASKHLTSPKIASAFSLAKDGYGVLLCAPGQAAGDGSETSANPGWRRAVALIVGRKSNTTNFDGLRTLAPDMGTYINEGSINEENWTESFWGSNYPRLSEIKGRYDPNMTFWVSPGINADFVQAVDGRACLVDPVPSTPSRFPPVTERRHMADMAVDGNFLFGNLEIIGTQFPQPGTEIGLQARPLNGSPCRQRL
ncbi:putative FAD-linked oxidoreductase [Fusarium oxysporum f. sp. cubense]|uniref:Putative FAD-linked oxidoreductase n=1 Tax=Fusarium oxysporum f. sp. cubense TaxID=61366 RepID=A0A559KWK0_FUSOC|nr:putative FAD-linked oxidoreductase [Fusarium oxysporum f. sp. cubense]